MEKRNFIANWILVNGKMFVKTILSADNPIAVIEVLMAVLTMDIMKDTPTINESEKWIKEAKFILLTELDFKIKDKLSINKRTTN
jgi:hypothetical protein